MTHRSYKWELLGLLCLAFFFHQGDLAIYGVVLPQIRRELQLSDSQLGFVGTVGVPDSLRPAPAFFNIPI